MGELGQCLQHPSTMDRPFGYLIHGDQAEPAPGPDAPPAGAPLLDPDEINQFFDLFSTSALDGTLEGLGAFGSFPAESNTQLHGVFSSLAQTNTGYSESHYSTLDRFDTGHGSGPLRMEPPTHGLANPNGSLLGTSAAGRPSHFASRANGFGYHTSSHLPAQRSMRPSNFWQATPDTIPLAELGPLGGQRPIGHPVSSSGNQIHPSGLSNAPGIYAANDASRRPILTFGSDAAFQAQYYAPPDNLDNMHTMEGRMMGVLAGLEAQPSANNTEPSSPLLNKTKRPRPEPDDQDGSLENAVDLEHDGPSRPKRVRCVQSDSTVKQDCGSASTPAPRSSRRDRSKRSLSSPQHRRRTSDGKTARQNLSEKQKQQNHIESEKRRRTHINAGIDDLMQLLPEGTVGSSKCVMLSRTVEWLSALKEGNKRLQAQLDSMDEG